MKIIINGEVVEIPGGSSTTPSNSGLPINSVILWAGTADTVPEGWHICDGTEGTIDLRDLFVLGAGGKYSVSDTGGSEEVTLTVAQMPNHRHIVSVSSGKYSSSATTVGVTSIPLTNSPSYNTTFAGGGEAHPNMPPYYALYYIQKIA